MKVTENIKNKLLKGQLKNCYIVIGPPRSGTSLLSNILNNSGIDFDTNLKQANIQNPDGFYEHNKLQHHNNKLLRFMTEHNKPTDFGFFLARDNKERLKEIYLMNKVNQALKKINKKTKLKWGIKDPALCITFRRLYHYFSDFRPIYIVRNPTEVVISEVLGGGSSPLKAIKLWEECVLNIINYKLKFGGSTILHHNLLKKDKNTLDAIKEYLDTKDESIFDVIKTEYYRSKGEIPLPDYTQKLWAYIQKIAQ